MNSSAPPQGAVRTLQDRLGRPYEPAVGPRLRLLLAFIFLAVALLGATAIYLTAIRGLEWWSGNFYQSLFSLWMFAAHQWVGALLVLPFLAFGLIHYFGARHRKNRVAVRLGVLLFLSGIGVAITGLALMQLDGLPQLPTGAARTTILWLHGLLPVLAVVLYVRHRRAGPEIRWRWGAVWGVGVVGFVAAMLVMHSHDPRKWHAQGSPEGEQYFEPSRARTVDGNFIPAAALMMDEYCLKCHPDIYKSHLHSAHKFSSFNNPAYLFSVRETRQRAGVRSSRWCAGCHDPVPFFSGQFDDPQFDDVKNPTAHAGITCTVCHSMTHVNSRSGNGDYTIEEPIHYPFAYSDDPVLQWLNNQLVKAKPEFHKRTFLKPFHRSEEFCSVCHKVGIPQEVNRYKEFLRGQNHPDSFLLSGVSGHGARSFYYPPKAKGNCAECHMPLMESNDFGARDFDGSGKRKVHNHLFPAANTGIPALVKYPGWEKIVEAHAKYLQGGPDGKSPPLRIDLFGLKDVSAGQGVEAPLIDGRPLRPHLPTVTPGGTYLVEAVVRTLNMGHHFTQGTADSNEVWVELTAKVGERVIGRSGSMDREDEGRVDENAHFLNVLMLDRHGNRIDRRNPQDIFTPLYDHQIPPGAANVLHYRLHVPKDLPPGQPLELQARVRYRKFDHRYMELVHGAGKVPKLPIVDLCSDKVLLPIAGVAERVPPQESPVKPAWQRWNDYGIGCFLEGGPDGKKGGELAAAEMAFARLLSPEFASDKAAHSHGHLNLARVHLAYGGLRRTEMARQALAAASKSEPPAPWQTVAWFNGLVNLENVNFDRAIADFETILDPKNRRPDLGFDFTKDFVVRAKLGEAYFLRSQAEQGEQAAGLLRKAVGHFEQVLQLDPENVMSHEFLAKCFARLGGTAPAPAAIAPAAGEEGRLAALVKEFADPRAPAGKRLAAARELTRALDAPDSRSTKGGIRLPVLRQLRQECFGAASAAEDTWTRAAATPVLRGLDRNILGELRRPGLPLLDERANRAARLENAAEMEHSLAQLGVRPPLADMRPPLLAASAFPSPGLPTGLALAGLAERGELHGRLPEPRLLTLLSLRQQARQVFGDAAEPEVGAAAARVLSRIHLLMHGIYKPDENAADHAVSVYRSRHPAADRASHSIVIYPLTP